MTDIQQLIQNVTPLIPFKSSSTADSFLQQYSLEDQAALISALYIGRDHNQASQIQQDYVPKSIPFDRFFHTGGGHGVPWLINPAEFKDILYEKNTALTGYFSAFLRCSTASGCDLSQF